MLRCQFLCHVLKALFFIKIASKLSYFCKKCKIFEQTPISAPILRISGYAPGQGQECLRPRTKGIGASVLQEKIIRIFFQAISKKKIFANFPQGFWRFPTKFYDSKNSAVFGEDRAIFEDLKASRPRPCTSKCVLEDSTSDTHSKLDLKSLVAFIDVSLVMTTNIILPIGPLNRFMSTLLSPA